MAKVQCEHCGAENDPTVAGGTCAGCGKGLPSRPAEQAGADAFKNARGKASGALFAVAAVHLLCGGFVLFAAPQFMAGGQAVGPDAVGRTAAILLGIVVVFAGLGVWALSQPLPAAVVGLVLYLLLSIADFAAAAQEKRVVGGIVMRVVFVIFLVQAVVVAGKARKSRPPRP
jgi:hypothetical protein